jgi:hypothetical protein
MRPKERQDSGQIDLLRSRLDAIVDMGHPLVKLAQAIDWPFLEERFGAVYEDKPGRPINKTFYSAASLAPPLFFRGAPAFFSTGARNFPV